MNVTKITRMEPNGPGGKGLDAWPKLPPEVVDEGDPVQTGYKYYEDDVTSESEDSDGYYPRAKKKRRKSSTRKMII